MVAVRVPAPELAGLLKQAMGDDRLWITPIVRMEILYSARSTSEYTAVETELDGFRILRNDRAVADAAMSALGELAERGDGYHRVPLGVSAAFDHAPAPDRTRKASGSHDGPHPTF
jgi:predicted nucleic acid-binding protein